MILLNAIVHSLSGNKNSPISQEEKEILEKTKSYLKEKWNMIRIVTILYFRNLF